MTTARIALAGATVWSLALVVGALTVPLYSGDSSTSDPTGPTSTAPSTATLVEVNGAWGLVVASVPLAASVVVGALLLGVRGRAAQLTALGVVGLLGLGTVLSLLSVGLFVAPVTAALGMAVLVSLSTTPHVRTAP